MLELPFSLHPVDIKGITKKIYSSQYKFGDNYIKMMKSSSHTKTTYALAGRLYVSKSGWGLLSVPNAIVRGCFDALHEVGTELPSSPDNGRLEAHITVFRPEDIEKIGGPDKVHERGHTFHYSLGQVKVCEPDGWSGISKVWFVEIKSPELEKLRKSYGLSARPKENKHDFHITIAIRKKNVLRENDITKISSVEVPPVQPPSENTVLQQDEEDKLKVKQQAIQTILQNPTSSIFADLLGTMTKGVQRTENEKVSEFSKTGTSILNIPPELKPHVETIKQLAVYPAVQDWFKSHGMTWNAEPHKNPVDRWKETSQRGESWDAMRMATTADYPTYYRMLKGMANIIGIPHTPHRERFIQTASGDIGRIAPYMMTFAPDLWDQLHGYQGTAAGLAKSLYWSNRNSIDPITGIRGWSPETSAEMAQNVHNQFFGPNADPTLRSYGYSSSDLGRLYESMQHRGLLMPEAGNPEATAQQLSAMAGPMQMLRSLITGMQMKAAEDYSTKEAASRWRTPEVLASLLSRTPYTPVSMTTGEAKGVVGNLLRKQPINQEPVLSSVSRLPGAGQITESSTALNRLAKNQPGLFTRIVEGVGLRPEGNYPVYRAQPVPFTGKAIKSIYGDEGNQVFQNIMHVAPRLSGAKKYFYSPQNENALQGYSFIGSINPSDKLKFYEHGGARAAMKGLRQVKPVSRHSPEAYEAIMPPKIPEISYIGNKQPGGKFVETTNIDSTKLDKWFQSYTADSDVLRKLLLAKQSAHTLAGTRHKGDDKVIICPHCDSELNDKSIYTDIKGWKFCRKCLRRGKGPIKISSFISLPHVKQETNHTCGPAAIESVEKHFGKEKSEATIANEAKTTSTGGTKPDDIIRVMENDGFKVSAKTMTLDELKKSVDEGKPVITPVQAYGNKEAYKNDESGHYVVITGYGDGDICFQDPATGKRDSWSENTFLERWHDKDRDGKSYKNYGIAVWKPEKSSSITIKFSNTPNKLHEIILDDYFEPLNINEFNIPKQSDLSIPYTSVATENPLDDDSVIAEDDESNTPEAVPLSRSSINQSEEKQEPGKLIPQDASDTTTPTSSILGGEGGSAQPVKFAANNPLIINESHPLADIRLALPVIGSLAGAAVSEGDMVNKLTGGAAGLAGGLSAAGHSLLADKLGIDTGGQIATGAAGGLLTYLLAKKLIDRKRLHKSTTRKFKIFNYGE